MSRVWTIEELDSVHPMPEPDDETSEWSWRIDPAHGPEAVDEDGARVYVDSIGRLCCDDIDGGDRRVALAVILASMGMDSYEAMAAALEKRGDMRMSIEPLWQGQGEGLHEAATMLRRGTVKP